MKEFKDKVAVITGAAGTIGRRRAVLGIAIMVVLGISILALSTTGNSFLLDLLGNGVLNIKVASAQGNTCTTGSTVNNGRCHDIVMEAVELPDEMFAYRMVEHNRYNTTGNGTVSGSAEDLTPNYSPHKPSVPGPTIVLQEGDEAFVTLVNQVSCDPFPDVNTSTSSSEVPSIAKVGIHVHGVHYTITSDGTPKSINKIADEAAACGGDTITYHWTAAEGTRGTWPYHDHTFLGEHGGEGLGLFGTLIVDGDTEPVKTLIGGSVVDKPVSEVSKEFILWMVSTKTLGKSVFYGMEIDNDNGVGGAGKQTPLWVNPTVIATEGKLVRFHVLGMGDEFHAFHMHAHRWIEPRSDDDRSEASHIIDTREIAPLERHVFAVQAGEGVGPGDWMYHCHVLVHMEEGMSGMFRVLPPGEDDTLPPVGAVFTLTDEPGRWFKTIDRGLIEVLDGTLSDGIGWPLDHPSLDLGSNSRSLAVIKPGETVLFNMKDSITLHTVTTLIRPEGAAFFDRQLMLRGSTFITDDQLVPVAFTEPGLYVFVCKIHPYMFGAVIVDADGALPLDLGENLVIATRTGGLPGDFPTTVPSLDPLAKSLLTTFFIVTDSTNWKDYTQSTWNVNLPAVDVTDGTTVVNLSALDIGPVALDTFDPSTEGVGEVWVNSQFELTTNKNQPGSSNDKPGTITVLDAKEWSIKRKIAQPDIKMNHPHNMWADLRQHHIYQTQWFDSRMAVVERDTGKLVKDVGRIGQSPSHVMTSPVNDKVYLAINGEEQVTEVDPVTLEVTRRLSVGENSHPHGHWISADGRFIVTPNFFALSGVEGSTIFDLQTNEFKEVDTGQGPIATGMMPDGSKYYTADFLGNTLTVINPNTAAVLGTIDLLAEAGAGLPIQTPVSPDGKWVVTANTLFSKITVVDTSSDTVVAALDCDPGCHGVQWGAKGAKGGNPSMYPYYAYVSNKFSNVLIVVDPDPNNDGDAGDAEVAGKVLLVAPPDPVFKEKDDHIIGHQGMGGQGVLAIPNVYNGWIQATVDECLNQSPSPCSDEINEFLEQLTAQQQDPS